MNTNKRIKLDEGSEVRTLIEENVEDLLAQSPVTDISFNKKVTERLMAANPIQFGKSDIEKVINAGKETMDSVPGLPAGSSDAISTVLGNLASKQQKMLVTMSSYLLLRSQQMSVGYSIRVAHLDHLNSVELYTQRVNSKTGVTLMFPMAAAIPLAKFFEANVISVSTWFTGLKCWSKFVSRVMNPVSNVEYDTKESELVVKKVTFNTDSLGNNYFHFVLFSHGQCQRVKQLFFEERASEPFNKLFVNYEVSRRERDVCKAVIGSFKQDVQPTDQVTRVSFSSGRLGIKVKSGLNKKEYALFSLTYDAKIKSIKDYNLLYNQEFGSEKNYVIFNGVCVLVPD